MSAQKTALIVGATGVVGRSLLTYLQRANDWNVITVSRRRPDIAGDYRHVAADLLSLDDARAKLGECREVTHVFYAAYVDRPDPTAWVNDNTRMFAQLLDVIEPSARGLKHVHVMEGTKWYGNHLGPFKTPAKETDPRHMPPNFYYNQQDLAEERQRGKAWSWSAARPHAICGFSLSSPMNLPLTIAVYAAICKELGLPLYFPGTAGNFHALYQACDAMHLAKAVVWMATDEKCANQAFNITNGDLIRWENVWPRFAKFFAMEPGMPRSWTLTKMMADKAPLWERIVAKHGLQNYPLEQLASWGFADFVFAPSYDQISDMSKARRFGFHDGVDTEDRFLQLFKEFREAKVVP